MIVSRISCALSAIPYPALEYANWVPAEGVSVNFDIHHRGTSILVKFMVREPQVRAVNTAFNSPVWEDSCVEVFISLEGDPNYYNFEFNAIGTVLGAYGPGRSGREWLPEEFLQIIGTTPSLGRGVIETMEGNITWELEIVLPVKSFCHHSVKDISGMKTRANFYKCGDGLRKPHYLSWKEVETSTPDFHQPRFFGDLVFQ